MARKTLIDTMPFAFRLEEASGAGGPLKVRGVFQRAGIENLNHRIYPFPVWEGILSDKNLKESLNARSMYGELDHPADGEIKLDRASHIVTKLELQPDGTVIGEAEILDTDKGRNLKAILEARGRVGISSRGSGTTVEESGTEVVQEDFRLDTFDFVATPSTPGAYPKVVTESVKQGKDQMTVEQKFKNLREQATKLITLDVGLLTESDRARLIEDSEKLTIELSRLISEDTGYQSLANELIEKLALKRAALNSSSAPPTVEKQIVAAQAVMVEMARQMSAREKVQKSRLGEIKKKFEAVAGKLVPVEKFNALKLKLDAANALGEATMIKLKRNGVKEHVSGILHDPKNVHLRTVRDVLEKCETTDAVDNLVEQLSKLSTKKTESRNDYPAPGATSTPARLIEKKQADRSRTGTAEFARQISKKLGHKY